MELNDFLFPSPKFTPQHISPYLNDILLIPKPNSPSSYIPTIYLPFIPTSKSHHISYEHSLLILFHSNGEDLFSSRIFANKLRLQLQINVLIVEYPGYSIYNSSKSCETVLEDTLILYDYIVCNEDKANDVYVIGRSIGTAPAIYLASKRKIAMLGLISPFTSIKSVVGNMFGFLKVLICERFRNVEYIEKVECPVLFVHGYKDKMIPYSETLCLKEKLKGVYEVLIQENMAHNEFDVEKDVVEPIREFMWRNGRKEEKDGKGEEGMWLRKLEEKCGGEFVKKYVYGSS